MTSFVGVLSGFGFLDFGFGHELKKHAKDDWDGLTGPLFGSWTGVETSGPVLAALDESIVKLSIVNSIVVFKLFTPILQTSNSSARCSSLVLWFSDSLVI